MRDDCTEIRLLVQADVDGELRPAEAARVAAHLESCADCAALQARLLALSARVRDEASTYPASAALRAAITSKVGGARPVKRRSVLASASFGAGFALAASLALLVLPIGGLQVQDEAVASHIRALQPGHLVDVISTDQHTVKPWFDGRLPFAPPVKDLAPIGFPLAGGRLDYLAGKPAAALVYRHGKHVIDLFATIADGAPDRPATTGARDGYNFVHWQENGMGFWAVSDLAGTDLAAFVRDWRKA